MKISLTILSIIMICLSFSLGLKAQVIISSPTDFATLAAGDGTNDGIFTVNGNLTITATGGISGNVNGATLTGANIIINVSGNVLLESGAFITSNQTGGSCSGGHAGNITVTAGGSFITQANTIISVNGVCSAGEININASGIVDIDGLVQSRSTLSGTGAVQAPGGGPITIIGGCSLVINDNGKVSSAGQDPGADLVHLEASNVVIFGLVESTGAGHAVPNRPINHLGPPNRPEKPANSTAGVEVWACTITIDKVSHNGEISADLTVGAFSVSWIDIFARNEINIIGGSSGSFAVHANNGGNQNKGGAIVVKSVEQTVTASGRALQSDGGFGGSGGTIIVHANNNLTLSGVVIEEATGVSNSGGQLELRSFNGDIVSSLDAILNVNAPTPGTITRQACGTIGSATIIPSSVVPTDNSGAANCGGNPTTNAVVVLPVCGESPQACIITGPAILPAGGGSVELCGPDGATSYSWSTGETTQCITVNVAAVYSLTVTTSTGCSAFCSAPVAEGQVNCDITTDNGKTSICPGGSIQLCAPAGLASYLWSTGETTQCITVSAAATYSVTVTNANGAGSTCNLQITVNTPPPCNITGNGAICPGGSTQLCAPAGLASYSWSTGATSQCITVKTGGTYSVTVTDANGCSSTGSKNVIVNSLPSCNITVCTSSTGNLQLCAPAGLASYLWSTGATTQCITVSASGTYSVTVTNSYGCSNTCSKCVTICNGFRTQTMGGWGAVPQGNNPGTYVKNNFAAAFPGPDYLTIGCSTGNKLKLTTWQSVIDFLPSGSTASALPAGTLQNPGAGYSNVFAGQLVAVTLSIKFDLTFANFSPSTTRLKDLIINSGPFAGWTVAAVVAEANKKIGGCTSSFSFSDLNSVLDAINKNYDNGNVNKGFLACPGTVLGRGIINPISAEEPSDAVTVKGNGSLRVSAYPNPFTSSTTIEFKRTDRSGHAVINIYTADGHHVATVFDKEIKAGIVYRANFDAKNLATGVYIYKIVSDRETYVGKLSLVK
ncbi:MAG: T9SS type A sorting domain-containing protein [Bacteroidota bacterium]